MDLGSPVSSTRRVAAANAVRKRPAWNAAYGTPGSGTGISPAVAGRSVGSPNTVAGGGGGAVAGGLGATVVAFSAGAAGGALAAGALTPGRLALGVFAAGRAAAGGGAVGFFSRT